MKCNFPGCSRDNLTEKELEVHTKYFHTQGTRYQPLIELASKLEPRPAVSQQPQQMAAGACPECGSTLWYEEGCSNCHACGFSKCG